MSDRQALRNNIRTQRRAIPAATARRNAARMAQHAARQSLLLNSRHIAGFLPADGEMDPLPLMYRLWALGKRIYLPVLIPFNRCRLWFARFEPGDELVYNRYGIPEPVRRRLIKPTALDLVLTPLVGFDADGNRLGMGGGYYDRSFAFLCRRSHWQKPRMLGIAHELQKLPAIDAGSWDIPLDAIVTEKMFYPARV